MGSPTFASINPMDNPNIAEYLGIQRRMEGRSMKALRIERESLLASLKATGQAQPATILWFNPVAGSLDGGIGLKLRSINDPHVLEDDQVTYKYRGRTYKAVVVPIKEPTIFSLIKDVKVEGDREYGVYEPRACKQIEIAYHIGLDEGALTAWFASALMRGWDEYRWRSKEYKRQVRRAIHPWWSWKRYFTPLSKFGH